MRVDQCYFERGDTAVGGNIPDRGAGAVWGVVDNCVFHNMGRPYYAYDWRFSDAALGSPDGTIPGQDYNGATAWVEPILPGSDHMMYVEHNTFNWDTIGGPPSVNAQGALYGSGGGRCCFRYNTLNGNDAAIDAHGDYPGHSTVYYEIYNNTFNVGALLPQGESAWNRGGQWIVHDNTFVGGGAARIKLSIYHAYVRIGRRTVIFGTMSRVATATNLTSSP